MTIWRVDTRFVLYRSLFTFSMLLFKHFNSLPFAVLLLIDISFKVRFYNCLHFALVNATI